MKKRVLVTGATGLVGSHFIETTTNLPFRLDYPRKEEFNLTDIDSLKSYLHRVRPNVVVNFAGITNVTEAEKQRNNFAGSAWETNVQGINNLVSLIKEDSSCPHLIHISTVAVFPGTAERPGPYRETDPIETSPERLSWYGFTKVREEEIIKNHLSNWAIIRISSPVRAHFPHRLDFARKLLRLAESGFPYSLFNDQYLSITHIPEASEVIRQVVVNKITGILHVSSADLATPYDFAKELLSKKLGPKFANSIKQSSIDEFLSGKNSRRYMKYGGLSSELTRNLIGKNFSTWREIIQKLILEGIA